MISKFSLFSVAATFSTSHSALSQSNTSIFELNALGREKTILADRIVFCSSFQEFTLERLGNFISLVFGNGTRPIIVDAANSIGAPADDAPVTVFFYAGTFKDEEAEECLERFPDLQVPVQRRLQDLKKDSSQELAEMLGLSEVGPVAFKGSQIKSGDDLVILFLSNDPVATRLNRALVFLFGLKRDYCETPNFHCLPAQE